MKNGTDHRTTGQDDVIDPALDARALNDICERVLRPVAHSLLTPDELEDIRVNKVEDDGIIWLVATLKARGETWRHALWHQTIGFNTYGQLAYAIKNSLQDWLSETSFAWGQLRQAEYVIPPR